ncbi:Uncharacterised protein [Roseburia inulinivorans]|jgi:hypothetical protein|uniref:Uncharacterized protein n=1 Tax=Roseburia inulinivorans TaxID=360807 RepID=A0A173THW8_9FIRM|nr:Uncharacterised protein [Roseburia inulinivorans]
MAMNTRNKLTGHMKRTKLVVFVSTVRTAVHGTTVRRITTMNHLVDIFDNRRTRMKFVNDRFIIISKDRL